MKYQFHIVDVFTPAPFAGNQLAVLPNAVGLTTEVMQRIAREFNFAESAFVFPPETKTGTHRVRIFTPEAELAFAGHPTIGTACALAFGGHVPADTKSLTFEEGVGPILVELDAADGTASATLYVSGGAAVPEVALDPTSLAKALSLSVDDVIEGFTASAGLPFCFARLSSAEAVDRAATDAAALLACTLAGSGVGIFLFAGELRHGADIYARMFAPEAGVAEDPGTGSACAALAGAAGLRNLSQDGPLPLNIVQGAAMGRRSEIFATAHREAGRLARISVKGAAAFVATGKIDVR